MKLNPHESVFGVIFEKFLGLIVTSLCIEANSDTIYAFFNMEETLLNIEKPKQRLIAFSWFLVQGSKKATLLKLLRGVSSARSFYEKEVS